LFEVYCDWFVVDVLVFVDLINWKVGVLVLMMSLCGFVEVYVEVWMFDYVVYSGMYGGVVVDVVIVLICLFVMLYDDVGDVVV